MKLKTYWTEMPVENRAEFAERCGTTVGYLRNVAYGLRACKEGLAIAIERESKGAVRCEESCPDADWAVLRRKARVA